MKNWLICVLAISLLGVFTSTANAGKGKAKKPKQSAAETFNRRDKDGNGMVTIEEFIAGKKGKKSDQASQVFKQRDKNTDGSLTLNEFKTRGKKQNKKKNA